MFINFRLNGSNNMINTLINIGINPIAIKLTPIKKKSKVPINKFANNENSKESNTLGIIK